MQAASDIFLGWTEDAKNRRHFYVRQLKNRRVGSIGELIEARALEAYGTLCARTLARAHARTGDPALLAGYMGKSEVFDAAIASFAMAYADVTSRDHARLIYVYETLPKSRELIDRNMIDDWRGEARVQSQGGRPSVLLEQLERAVEKEQSQMGVPPNRVASSPREMAVDQHGIEDASLAVTTALEPQHSSGSDYYISYAWADTTASSGESGS